jgi:hypothetical protein
MTALSPSPPSEFPIRFRLYNTSIPLLRRLLLHPRGEYFAHLTCASLSFPPDLGVDLFLIVSDAEYRISQKMQLHLDAVASNSPLPNRPTSATVSLPFATVEFLISFLRDFSTELDEICVRSYLAPEFDGVVTFLREPGDKMIVKTDDLFKDFHESRFLFRKLREARNEYLLSQDLPQDGRPPRRRRRIET